MGDKLIIEQNKRGSILYIAGAIIMSVLSAILTFTDFRSMRSIAIIANMINVPIIYAAVKVILFVGIIFFAYIAFYLIRRVNKKDVILQADIKGITDNSSAISLGYIPWTDVKRVYLDQMLDNKFIELELYEADKYLSKISSLKRKTIEVNLKMGHQAVCITLNSTGRDPHEICLELQRLYLLSKEDSLQ